VITLWQGAEGRDNHAATEQRFIAAILRGAN
jgi:hypothetical protein